MTSTTFTDGTTTIVADWLNDVDSVVYPNVLKTKIIDIGDWDMDTNLTKTIAHTIDHTKVRGLSAIIRDDAGSAHFGLHFDNTAGTSNQGLLINASNIILYRSTAGIFDGANYNLTPYNRGWVVIQYI